MDFVWQTDNSRHTNAVTEKVEKKSACVELAGNVVEGCGICKNASQPDAAATARAPGLGHSVQDVTR